MVADQKIESIFETVIDHVKNTAHAVNCTGSALLIMQNDKVVAEEYWGTHSKEENARRVIIKNYG